MSEISESAKNKRRIRFIVNNGIIAALYVVLTLPFAQIAPSSFILFISRKVVRQSLVFLAKRLSDLVTMRSIFPARQSLIKR